MHRSAVVETPGPKLLAVVLLMLVLVSTAGMIVAAGSATAQTAVEQLVSGVVRIRAYINPDGRTVGNLGAERSGTGIVIGSDGLVLTIGYLMVEAQAGEVELNDGRKVAAEIVGYDYDTGFGLLRATMPLGVAPVPLGRSADLKAGDRVLVAVGGGVERLGPARVAARREFAGYWEYLLEEAIFTSPPYSDWSGAALINREGQLVGVGSLVVGDTSGKGAGPPGNMFVPIDPLEPILAELIAGGAVSGPARPWLGITTDDQGGTLVVRRTTPGAPADTAGVRSGDRIVRVGQTEPRSLAELYRAIWGLGNAGVAVPLEVERDGKRREIEVKSVNRREHLKLDPRL
ncbi:MAG: S1C family serine protease [Hyphomicrobiaceae bacterium]|nr:S1C family serine protease [Hyphomicrobiaceae bacterium]